MDFGILNNQPQTRPPVYVPPAPAHQPVTIPTPQPVEQPGRIADLRVPVAPDMDRAGELPSDYSPASPELLKDSLNAFIHAGITALLACGTPGASVVIPYTDFVWSNKKPMTFEAFRARVRSLADNSRTPITQRIIRYASADSGNDRVKEGIELTIKGRG